MNRTIRVLHLEDSPHDAELIGASLGSAKVYCNIVCVRGRAEFEAMAGQRSFDLILCDYNVPGYDGLSALRFVRSKGLETPVIMISGLLGEDEAVECLTNGATDYLLKQRLGRLPSAVTRALQIGEEQVERKRAELALRENERFMRAMLDAVSFPIGVLDDKGCVTAHNVAWREVVRINFPHWLCQQSGTDYLSACEKAAASGDKAAMIIARGLRDIFACRATEFEAQVLIQTPAGARQFFSRLTRFPDGGPVRVAVNHTEIPRTMSVAQQSADRVSTHS